MTNKILDIKKQDHFGLRKYQGYGLAGALLATTLLGTGAYLANVNVPIVHAQETNNKASYNKVVRETVHYIYEDGDTAAPDHVQEVNIGDYTGYQQTFEEVKSPEIKGFFPDQDKIPAITVNDNANQIVRTVVYRRTPTANAEKYWSTDNGKNNVDNKTFISEDTLESHVSMPVPDQSSLAKKVSVLEIADNYSQFANYVENVSARVYQGGKDVTDQYNITNTNGVIKATAKNPASVPEGQIAIITQFKLKSNTPSGIKLDNYGYGHIDDTQMTTAKHEIVTYKQTSDRHFVEGSQNVDGKTYINGDNIFSDITMSLPDSNSLGKKLNQLSITDNTSNITKNADILKITVLENGKDVTNQYLIRSTASAIGQPNGVTNVTATRKDPSSAPGGKVTLHIEYKIHDNVPSGTQLVNSGTGSINNSSVNMDATNVVTYKQNTDKHWTENNQVVDGKTVLNDDVLDGQISMTLPDPSQLSTKLKSIILTDDYSQFKNNAEAIEAHVYENGKDVTNEYTVSINKLDGKVIAERKDPSKTPKGNAVLKVKFKINADTKSGTKLVNVGSGTINNNTVNTDTKSVETYVPAPIKHWMNNGNITDNQVYTSGDIAIADITAALPNDLANWDKLRLVDDYSQFANDVKVSKDDVKIFEDGLDKTNFYNIRVNNGKVSAVRKDFDQMGKSVSMQTSFHINQNVKSTFTNKGSITVNSDIKSVNPTEISIWTPKARRDVEAGDEVKGDTPNSINNSLILSGDNITYPLSTDDLPANRAENIKSRYLVDTLPSGSKFVSFKAWMKDKQGKLIDVTNHIKLTQSGQELTFTDDDYLLSLYNKDKSKSHPTPIIDLVVKNEGQNANFRNNFKVYTNDSVQYSNSTKVHTGNIADPIGHNYNDEKVVIDGQAVLPGSINNYDWVWKLDQYKGLNVSDAAIKKGFFFVNDYPDNALNVDPAKISYTDSQGQEVKGISAKIYDSIAKAPKEIQDMLAEQHISPQGKFIVFKADNPEEFFKNYVQKGDNIEIKTPMTVKDGYGQDGVNNTYQNTSWQVDFGKSVQAKSIVSNVPQINPEKDVVPFAGSKSSLSDQAILRNSTFDYALHGAIIPANGTGITEYGAINEYNKDKDQYTGNYKAYLSTDILLKDGTLMKKGTDISKYVTAKDENGKVVLEVTPAFLAKVDFSKSKFGVDFYVQMKRIGQGLVNNSFVNTVNGLPYKSNIVQTNTQPEQNNTQNVAKEIHFGGEGKNKTSSANTNGKSANIKTNKSNNVTPAKSNIGARDNQTGNTHTPTRLNSQSVLPATGAKAADNSAAIIGLTLMSLTGLTGNVVLRKKKEKKA